jgi:23S rRNA (uracil1939-C5)-methyltransferase
VRSCQVLDARLDEVLPDLGALFSGETGDGEATLALGTAGKPVAELEWEGELSPSVFAALERLVDGGRLAGAEVWLKGARRPARFGDPRAITLGADGEALTVPSGSFAQAHPAMNVVLGARVLAAADADGRDIVELFAGSGNFTVLLARHAASVISVESDGRAVDAARDNLRRRGLSARIVNADADAYELPPAARTVVLDPPRGGARGAIARLARSRVRRIVYVSCDPSTLARDVATLGDGGFGPVSLETFEMFPHTSHVELLVVLDRPAGQNRRTICAAPAEQRGPAVGG